MSKTFFPRFVIDFMHRGVKRFIFLSLFTKNVFFLSMYIYIYIYTSYFQVCSVAMGEMQDVSYGIRQIKFLNFVFFVYIYQIFTNIKMFYSYEKSCKLTTCQIIYYKFICNIKAIRIIFQIFFCEIRN